MRQIVPAETPLQAELIELWEELLDRRPIGISDSFFELGGHSLMAMRLLSRIAEKWNVTLPLRRLFETPVLADIAAAIDTAPKRSDAAPALRIQPAVRRRREPVTASA